MATFDTKYRTTVAEMIAAATNPLTASIAKLKTEYTALLVSLNNEFAQLKSEISSLKTENSALLTKVNDTTATMAAPSYLQIASQNIPKEVQLDLLNRQDDETRERRERESNVVIFGLPLAQGDNPEDRAEHDRQTVNTIFKDILNISVKPKNIKRFRGKEGNYSGPIKVPLKSVTERNVVLKAAKLLKNNQTFSNVFIRTDETPAQQKRSKELRDECKLKNNDLPSLQGQPLALYKKQPFRFCVRNYTIVKFYARKESSDNTSQPELTTNSQQQSANTAQASTAPATNVPSTNPDASN